MFRFYLALTVLPFLAVASFAAEPGWKAGFATEPITPKAKQWMSGYASRTAPAEGTATELYAKAALLEPASGPMLVLVSLDLVGIDRIMGESIAKLICEKHKLKRESVCLACSHTHCGPVVGSTLRSMYFLEPDQAKLVEDYTKALPGLILKAVNAAFEKREAVELLAMNTTCGFAVNRRENKEADVPMLREKGQALKGPVDHGVPVLAARNSKGKWVGILFGYACHATTLAYNQWNGDWPGYAMAALEAAHPGATALFFAGCGADQNPIPRRSEELAKKYGKELATAVSASLKDAGTALKSETHAIFRTINLPLHDLPTREHLIVDSMKKEKYIAARAKMLLARIANNEPLPETYPYPVQSWQIGGQKLVILGGEVVVDYALRLKKDVDAKLWIMGYANDVMAYIPSQRVLKEGGYEGATSMIYYGMPSVWSSRIEEMIVQEVRKQLK